MKRSISAPGRSTPGLRHEDVPRDESAGAAAPTMERRAHPRTIGWIGTTALAMGGSNQMLFLVGSLISGQASIPGQGTAAIPLLAVGLVLGWMAMFGWTELILMFPNRVGGIAATCGEAFRPYAPVLGNLTGVCYWWGWVPTCGLTALLSASAINQWFIHLPDGTTAARVGVPAIACGIVLTFSLFNVIGVRWAARLAVPIGVVSAVLAFISAVAPVVAGRVDWHAACTFHLVTPFSGFFGRVTSAMAGLYLVGFAAPAFEAAACHVGETIDYERNVPRAMFASAIMATLYFVALPVVWLGAIGGDAMAGDLATTLGPTFAPAFFGFGKAAAIGFMMFNMFHGTLAPLTGVARTLSQLSEDGLLPELFARRNRFDCPWVAVTMTAGFAIIFLLIGDPVWLIAAANFTYLIGISLPNIAVWLLRRDQPDMLRPYRAPRGTITAGVIAAIVWATSTILGFEQFGLRTVIFGLVLAYSGVGLYALRKWHDRRAAGNSRLRGSLHVKLTGAMLLVLSLDGAGYLIAVQSAGNQGTAMIAALEDIFVVAALLTVSVGLVLPGMIAHSAVQVAQAADRLATGTLADFSRAMEALAAGNLDAAHARVDVVPVVVHSRDEVGQMAASFNTMQAEVARAAVGLDGAREGLREARDELTQANAGLEQRVRDRTVELETAHKKLVDAAWHAGMADVASGVLHNVGNVLNSVNVSVAIVDKKLRTSRLAGFAKVTGLLREHEADLGLYLEQDEKGRQLPTYLEKLVEAHAVEQGELLAELGGLRESVDHIKQIVNMQQSYARIGGEAEELHVSALLDDALRINFGTTHPSGVTIEKRYAPDITLIRGDKHRLLQVLVNLISNAKYAVETSGRADKRITLTVEPSGGSADDVRGRLIVRVADNGVGIAPESVPRVFDHGFTTKPTGHGFGLHASAMAARQVGGSLTGASAGPGLGAEFALSIPHHRAATAAAAPVAMA